MAIEREVPLRGHARVMQPSTSVSYRIVFQGDILPGQDVKLVKLRLARFFRLDRASLEDLFSGHRVTVRKGLSRIAADRFSRAFRRAGAHCLVIAEGSPDGAPDKPTGFLSKTAAQAPSDELLCPNCGRKRSAGKECLHCGIIFDRFERKISPDAFPPMIAGSIKIYPPGEESRKLRFLIFLLAILAFVIRDNLWLERDSIQPPGVLVREDPKQTLISNGRPWKQGERLFVPLAAFMLRARVLSKESYTFDAGADIAPWDLALGWGPMSDQHVLDQLDISQGQRRFMVMQATETAPLPWPEIMSHSANMHLIPSTKEVEEAIGRVRRGEIVEIKGLLVGIQEHGQWTWYSSLTRNDTGDGACEVIWVQDFKTVEITPPRGKT